MQLEQQLKSAQSWEERYRLLIQAGKNQTRPSPEELAQMQEISGCEARLWLKISQKKDRTLALQAFSEARIMNGMLLLLLQTFNVLNFEQQRHFKIEDYFAQFGISQRLSSSRLNGFKQIEQMIQKELEQ